ncbi:hypothetical protein [Trinickia mobilis]|uniref:hypothetical protein n=1 Tax=Trinickia mobilis TaxID=2816356 RepID=UPI001A8EDC46|nr:hypothetical protein [Trinickia mobilis]
MSTSTEREIFLQILIFTQLDIAAGRYRDLDVFLAELDSEDEASESSNDGIPDDNSL